jgi:hypothetical protein
LQPIDYYDIVRRVGINPRVMGGATTRDFLVVRIK